ncbi:MAG: glycosyltransferase [Verrucomicrobiota bacterium]
MPASASTPLVTVITSTFNRSATLKVALQGLLNQDFADFESLVIGDGCTDDSEQAVKSLNDSRLNWINLPTNSGSQTVPNNEGLRRARGKYVAFLGHDDLWLPWHLSTLAAQIRKNGADLVHDLSINIGPEGVLDANGPPHPLEGYDRIYVPTSSWLHRRELFEEVGGWRDPWSLLWPIDYDFSRRVAVAGKRIEYVPSLGVLKFPSLSWKTYALSGKAPAKKYFEAIRENPEALARRVLTELATKHAQLTQQGGRKTFRLAWYEFQQALTSTAKAALRGMCECYGVERWPLQSLLRNRFQRIRVKNRKRRGL